MCRREVTSENFTRVDCFFLDGVVLFDLDVLRHVRMVGNRLYGIPSGKSYDPNPPCLGEW